MREAAQVRQGAGSVHAGENGGFDPREPPSDIGTPLRVPLRTRWERTLKVLHAPRVQIEVYGDDEVRTVFRNFTARHRRVWFAQAKRWGVALLRLPESFDEYVAQGSRLVRRKRKHALNMGFRYAAVTPVDRLDEIIEINRSARSRHGEPMPPSYTDPSRVLRALRKWPTAHGILDARGRLRAYATVVNIGEVFTFTKVLGHADDLEDGIMYLLISEVVRECIDIRRTAGSPSWLMYDTYWGGSEGLSYFKERMGFVPYVVKWVWVDGA